MVVVLILIAGGVFWWQEDKIEIFLENKKLEKIVAPSKDYIVVEDSGGKFIINKKDGLKIRVPTEWEVESEENMEILKSDREVTLYSKDFSYRPPKGCLSKIQINRLQKMPVEKYNGDIEIYPFEGAEEIREIINQYKEAMPGEKENMQKKGVYIIVINQKEALRETIILKENAGKYVTLKIPTENKLYIFEWLLFSEECNEKLNQFLETVSIK